MATVPRASLRREIRITSSLLSHSGSLPSWHYGRERNSVRAGRSHQERPATVGVAFEADRFPEGDCRIVVGLDHRVETRDAHTRSSSLRGNDERASIR